MEAVLAETKNLTKKFGEQIAVNKVCLHLKKGRTYGLIGRNGSGKTTIMKMILGLTKKTDGEITLFGQSMDSYRKDIYSKIGSLIESPGFYPNMTGTENLEYFARLRGEIQHDAIEKSLFIAGLPYKDDKKFSGYSVGMKQRLGIANAIVHNPEFLILDEPTNGLDPIGIAEVRTLIKRLRDDHNTTILISSHQLSEMEQLVDDIGIIHNGELIEECTYADLIKRESAAVYIHVSNPERAVQILQKQCSITNLASEGQHIIKIIDEIEDTSIINRELMKSGIDVFEIYVKRSSLEDYFKQITGGESLD
ncbi:ABC transporter ATP-binding protein [Bacillus sp. AGMB 02131]|uniref:ABC transporter ATP-binding protein n=1 Tax=Peribacillus faecalis TaxID=2772559 RepID=A0A927CV75_9BACI|nr:ABC transporter ATP-binding protein [Peribacillus faecalis]MBD3108422.1 ABC transporter ATP-binding protein [Peribacillus faecalis]